MIDHIDRTLSLWRSTPFAWGQSDCMLSVGDYIASRTGRDVSVLFRGTYDTEQGALEHVERHGGATGLVDLTGLARTNSPVRGDVLVICGVGALCTGRGAVMRMERGIVEIEMRFIRDVTAWSIK